MKNKNDIFFSQSWNVFNFFSRSWSELTDIRLDRVRVNEVKLYFTQLFATCLFIDGIKLSCNYCRFSLLHKLGSQFSQCNVDYK